MLNPAQSASPLASYTPVNAAAMAKRTTGALIAIAALIALIGAGAFFMINAQIQQQVIVQNDRQAQVGSAQQVASRDSKAHSDFAQVQSQLRFVNDPVDIKSYVPTLLPQIESVANSYNLQVSSITPGAMSAPITAATTSSAPASATSTSETSAPAVSSLTSPTYQTMALTLNLSGSYPDVMKFVYGLTRFPKVVSLKEISLHPSGGADSKSVDKVGVNLQLVAYVFAPATSSSGSQATSTSTIASTSIPGATASISSPAISITQPRPEHGVMISPIALNPLPKPGSLMSVSKVGSSAPVLGQSSLSHK